MSRPRPSVPLAVSALAALASGGCVLSVDHTFAVDEPIDRIVLELGSGDARVEGTDGDRIQVEVDLGGIGSSAPGHEVRDGVLFLDYACGKLEVCGGELTVRAPRGVDLELAVGAGDLSVEGMAGIVLGSMGTGSVEATGLTSERVELAVGTGSAEVELLERPRAVHVTVSTGSIRIDVPSGPYALDLTAKSGAIETTGVSHDPQADARIDAVTALGDVRIHGR